MYIQLDILRRKEEIRAALLRDGWRLHPQPHGALHLCHGAVKDEPTARERLDRVGLLTSNHVRIRFEHHTPILARSESVTPSEAMADRGDHPPPFPTLTGATPESPHETPSAPRARCRPRADRRADFGVLR